MMKKVCKQCKGVFEVTDVDRAFLDKMAVSVAGRVFEVPDPSFCPLCRFQRRLVWRGELDLFARKSDLSGESTLSYLPESCPQKIYTVKEWYSNEWDAMSFGRDFDFSRTFFEQFEELLLEVPTMALAVTSSNENSDYINCASGCRDCYLIAGANYVESCMYGNYLSSCKDCVDCSFVDKCELCYECVDCKDCYGVLFGKESSNCSDCWFIESCRGCRDCFGSVNLVNKQYVFFNEQLSKEEYERRVGALDLTSREGLEVVKKRFMEHRKRYPKRYMQGVMNENVLGNCASGSRNCYFVFDVGNCEDCRYCTWLNESKDCMDCYAWGFTAEKAYECCEVGDGSVGVMFSVKSFGCSDVYYCHNALYSQNLFGCVGLNRKEYCILNKQYSKEEYEEMVGRIIEHMEKNGEWGEFFPMGMSPLCYNQSIAKDYYPVSKEQAVARGAKWAEERQWSVAEGELQLVPDDLEKVKVGKVYHCGGSYRPFKLNSQEVGFYKRMGLPAPDLCFWERHKRRNAKRLPRYLWERCCDKCGVKLHSAYQPGGEERIYCERCFQEEVG